MTHDNSYTTHASGAIAPIPVLTPESGLKRYLQQIQTFPLLSAEEELALAKRWRDEGDVTAAHRLATSHLRLVAKIAMGYRGYGLPVGDLIAEGNIGMMQAIKKFDPDKGFRLTTYAIWWIKAAIQEYILKSWSLVKIGTSSMQKKLFFNLRKIKRKLGMEFEGELTQEGTAKVAHLLGASVQDVTDMNRRLVAHDRSLDAKIGGEDGDGGEWMDLLADTSENQETILANQQELSQKRALIKAAMATLTPRELDILMRRELAEEPDTLEMLSERYKISRERVRQIGEAALKKIKKYVDASA